MRGAQRSHSRRRQATSGFAQNRLATLQARSAFARRAARISIWGLHFCGDAAGIRPGGIAALFD
jgi:1,2-phenylacetyl-CoA epoxidase PaaB subunit